MKEKLLVVLSDRGEDRSELSAEIAKLLTSRDINHKIYLAKSIDDMKAVRELLEQKLLDAPSSSEEHLQSQPVSSPKPSM